MERDSRGAFIDGGKPHLNPYAANFSPKHKSVDSWIDDLTIETLNIVPMNETTNIQMQMLIQQRLPTQTLPIFDGNADKWVHFVSNFFDMVHKQPYLDCFQKRTYLVQHLTGEPLKAIEGYPNDAYGYISSLQRLKYMFGNPSQVAQATIRRVTIGPHIPDGDIKALTEYYYTLSSCLNTLRKMDYTADIHSTSVLRQALRRLPDRYLQKWAEYSFKLRRTTEPNLNHLEQWLQDRVMAARDPYLPFQKPPKTKYNNRLGTKECDKSEEQKGKGKDKTNCVCCGDDSSYLPL